MAARAPRKVALARNPWTREQEARECRRCGALPGTQCVTAAGTGAPAPHAERYNDAMAAMGKAPVFAEGTGRRAPEPPDPDERYLLTLCRHCLHPGGQHLIKSGCKCGFCGGWAEGRQGYWSDRMTAELEAGSEPEGITP